VLATPQPATSFQGLFDDNVVGHIPPDTNGAVGPDRIMVTLNSQVVFQEKGNGQQLSAPVSQLNFWGGVPNLTKVVDPIAVFDPYSNRWFVAAIPSGGGTLLLAISHTSAPTSDWHDWYQWSVPTGGPSIDQPKIGFNGKWIVVQGDSGNPVYSKIFVFDKASMIAGAPPTPGLGNAPGQNYKVITGTPAQGGQLSPARTYEANLSELYLLQSHVTLGQVNINLLNVFAISGTAAQNAALSSVGTVSSGTFFWSSRFATSGGTLGAPQSSSLKKIYAFDDRINSCVYRNGSLWAAHTVFVPANATPTISAVQWWQISVSATDVLNLVQRGVIGGVGDSKFRAYPSLAVNVNSDALIGYAIFSSTSHPSAAYSFRLGSDAPSTLQLPEGAAATGMGQYERPLDDNAPALRWGDYTATAVDPTNDRDMWTIQQSSGVGDIGQNTPWETYWNRIAKIFGRFAAGTQHSFGQRLNGTLSAAGQNTNGQLGTGGGTTYVPAPVLLLSQTIDVAAGNYNSLAVNRDGTVYAWGSNQYGQLGNGSNTGQAAAPTPVPGLNLFTNGYPPPLSTFFGDSPHIVSSGFGTCAAVDSLGQVWTWGVNYNGQLGDGTTSPHYSPAKVKRDASGISLTGVVSIAAGADQMVALKSDGTVWAWGWGCNGALGDGSLTCSNHNQLYPQQVLIGSGQPLTNVAQVVCGGSDFALALTRDGKLYGWGANGACQLGVGDTANKSYATYVGQGADRVAAGAYHSLLHSTDGLVYAWGNNGWGQLGLGPPGGNQSTPIAMVGQPTPRFTDMAAGAFFSLMIRGSDNVVYGAGDNQSGQLAVSGYQQQNSPTLTQYPNP
jgi:alpha-tubulin suppressor-like RCC1 family protein